MTSPTFECVLAGTVDRLLKGVGPLDDDEIVEVFAHRVFNKRSRIIDTDEFEVSLAQLNLVYAAVPFSEDQSHDDERGEAISEHLWSRYVSRERAVVVLCGALEEGAFLHVVIPFPQGERLFSTCDVHRRTLSVGGGHIDQMHLSWRHATHPDHVHSVFWQAIPMTSCGMAYFISAPPADPGANSDAVAQLTQGEVAQPPAEVCNLTTTAAPEAPAHRQLGVETEADGGLPLGMDCPIHAIGQPACDLRPPTEVDVEVGRTEYAARLARATPSTPGEHTLCTPTPLVGAALHASRATNGTDCRARHVIPEPAADVNALLGDPMDPDSWHNAAPAHSAERLDADLPHRVPAPDGLNEAVGVPPAAIARRPPCDDWIEGSVNQYSEGGPAACGAIAMTVVVEALRSGCLTPQVLDGAVRTGVAQHRGADQLETFEVVMSCSAVEVVDHRQFESPDELVDFLAALDDRGVDAVMITKPPETVAAVRCEGGWWFCDSHPRPEEGLRNAFALRFTSLKALASRRRGKSPLITMADIPQLNVCEVFLLRRAVSAPVAVATRDVEAAVRSRNDGASVERAILQNLPPPQQDVRGLDAPETPLAGVVDPSSLFFAECRRRLLSMSHELRSTANPYLLVDDVDRLIGSARAAVGDDA